MKVLATAGPRILALDLTDDASSMSAEERIRDEMGHLDVLVSNVRYGSFGAVEDVPAR